MWLCLSYKQKLINWITTNDCRFVIKTCKDHDKEKWKTFFLFSLCLLALPVIQTRAHLPAHLSCVNAPALPPRRTRRVRTWWRRVQTTPLTSRPPRPSRSSRERTRCSRHAAAGRTQRWVQRFTWIPGWQKSQTVWNCGQGRGWCLKWGAGFRW